MHSHIRLLSFTAALLAASSAVAAPPQLDSLSSASVTQSGRVRLFGAGFGAAPGLSPAARVEIGGVPVATARWSETAISAYVTAAIAPGETTIRVVNSDGTSESLPLTVEPLPPPDGRVAWRFQVDGSGVRHRVGIGPDGTMVASDALGFVYALSADGLLRWIHDGPRRAGHESGSGNEGPVAIGADGAVYVGIDPPGPDLQLHALRPDGTLDWVLNEPGASTVSGPAIGPEGDIYWAVTAKGGGLQRITPEGALVWAQECDPLLDEALGERSPELLFGPSTSGGPVDRAYFALRLGNLYEGMPLPPFLYSVDLEGEQQWSVFVKSMAGSFTPRGQVAVAPSGTVYLSSFQIPDGWGLHAYDPGSGARTWSYYPDPGNIVSAPEFDADENLYVMHDGSYLTSFAADRAERWEVHMGSGSAWGPTLSPTGALILIDGLDVAPDGGLLAFEAETGASLWTLPLPKENGNYHVPSARARFTADGSRAYVSTAIGGQPAGEEYGYIYALDVEEPPSGETTGESTGGEESDTDAGTSDEGTSSGAETTMSPESTTATEQPTTTNSPDPEDSSGTGESGETDGSSASDTSAQADPGSGGCGCVSAGAGNAPAGLLVGALGLLGLRRRRRSS